MVYRPAPVTADQDKVKEEEHTVGKAMPVTKGLIFKGWALSLAMVPELTRILICPPVVEGTTQL
jgi:hypothetical protein